MKAQLLFYPVTEQLFVFNKEAKLKYKYILWVGGTPDYYVNYKDVLRDYDEWIEKGYDDVIIEKIKKGC